jgi:hypothetical protein
MPTGVPHEPPTCLHHNGQCANSVAECDVRHATSRCLWESLQRMATAVARHALREAQLQRRQLIAEHDDTLSEIQVGALSSVAVVATTSGMQHATSA